MGKEKNVILHALSFATIETVFAQLGLDSHHNSIISLLFVPSPWYIYTDNFLVFKAQQAASFEAFYYSGIVSFSSSTKIVKKFNWNLIPIMPLFHLSGGTETAT